MAATDPVSARAPLGPVHAAVAEVLDDHGKRYTTLRRTLIEVLAGRDQPATIPELVESHPDLFLSSTYRVVRELVDLGLLVEVSATGTHACFELGEAVTGTHRHHAACRRCGEVYPTPLWNAVEEAVSLAVTELAEGGFEVDEHLIEFRGTCADCR